MMELPKPTEGHDRLEMFVGSWQGTEILHPSPWDSNGGTAKGFVENRRALGGFSLIQEYRQERDGKTTFEGHGVFTYDPEKDEYVLYWFDSMGLGVNDYRGKLEDGVLTVEHQGEMGHSRCVFDMRKEGSYTFRMQGSPDGSVWMSFMDGTYQKS
ncbi:MAG: DUF1579 family protein [Planctomycetota bacterium]